MTAYSRGSSWLFALMVLICSVAADYGVLPINLRVGCTDLTSQDQTWHHNISFLLDQSDASFLVLRFAFLQLPQGAELIVRDAVDYASPTTALQFSADKETDSVPFYTHPLATTRVIVEYTVPLGIQATADECVGFYIDEIRFAARGADRTGIRRTHNPHNDRKKSDDAIPSKSTGSNYEDDGKCTSNADSTIPVACVQYDATMFTTTRAVARLLVHKPYGSIFCTGWLVGCEGHILTNHHCVENDRDANATTIEFLAQGRDCDQDCDQPMGCPGTVEATSARIVAASPINQLDFTLLLPRLSVRKCHRLPTTYGFLSLRSQTATLHERIFIPQHPNGYGKRIALKHDTEYGEVATVNDSGCNTHPSSLGYFLDTSGGSSGSPVIAYTDQAVVGLHYCGGCLNSAVPASRILAALVRAGVLPHCARVG